MSDTILEAIKDATQWKEEILPFPTNRNDWALWIHPEAGRWIYIEHPLIVQIMEHVPKDPESENHWHDCFMGIGHKMLKCLMVHGEPEPGLVRVGQFAGCPVDFRFGQFDGRIFVFQPRYDIEKRWEEVKFKENYGSN